MRQVFAVFFSIVTLLVLPAAAASLKTPRPTGITLLLKFEEPHSALTIEEMKREVAVIMKDTGIQFDFRMLNEVGRAESFSDLVVVKFNGKCRMEIMAPISPVMLDERGPLAFTHTSDGEVLPFSEVACDRIRGSVSSAMWGGDHKRADLLLGRALGRVVAHELYHIVANTGKHASKGVAQTSLSGSQLISDHLVLNESDVDKFR